MSWNNNVVIDVSESEVKQLRAFTSLFCRQLCIES